MSKESPTNHGGVAGDIVAITKVFVKSCIKPYIQAMLIPRKNADEDSE